VVFDLLEAYKRTQRTDLPSYRLGAVADAELDHSKQEFEGAIGDLWKQHPIQLAEYNLRDVELVVQLDRAETIIDFWNEVRTIVGCELDDAYVPGKSIDIYLLRQAKGRLVLPSRRTQSNVNFEGGEVFDPITGLVDDVAVLDLKSLYPMVIATLNASPETKVDPEAFTGPTRTAPNGVHFRQDITGITQELIESLLDQRETKKAERDTHPTDSRAYDRCDRQQAALKVLMNALFGTFGWNRFRLYDAEISAAVTAASRAVLNHTKEVIEDCGGFRRTLVGLKPRDRRRPGRCPRFRRTLVGLKRSVGSMPAYGYSFRRTLVGLKPRRSRSYVVPLDGFRRTLVGLKRGCLLGRGRSRPVSDEPSWG